MIYFALPFLLNPLLKHIRLLNNYWFQKLKLNIYLFIKKILPSSPLNKLKFRPAKKSLLHLIVIRKLDDLLLGAVEKISIAAWVTRGAIVDPMDEATQLHDNRLKNAATRVHCTSQGDFFDCSGGR